MTTEKKARTRAYQNAWYAKNKGKRDAANSRWEAKNIKLFREFKQSLACVRCGEREPFCLEFHHTDPSQKDFDVSTAVRGLSQKRLMEEIEKCLVLCANCHRKEHKRLKELDDGC